MDDQQLLRYSRQILLPEIDVKGQQTLLKSRVLIIGLGGLGSPAAMYLAAAGVGTLAICDDDQVDLSNLQRQIAHHSDEIGEAKVHSAARTLLRLNPDVRVVPIPQRLRGQDLIEEIGRSQVVVDCSDNFATRFEVNAASVATGTPLVSGAVIRFEGQVAVFTPGEEGSPCYHCLFPNPQDELNESCIHTGVIAPLPGIVGSLQALEAVKLLLQIGQPSAGRLVLFDALCMEWSTVNLRRHPKCPTCSRATVSSGTKARNSDLAHPESFPIRK